MSQDAFDAVTRRAADAVSRRASLLALGGAALAASLAEPAVAKKNKNKKKRIKKQVKKKCGRQVGACQAFFSGFCSGIQECEEEFFPCCDRLGSCDAAGMLNCLFTCSCGGMPTEYEPPS